MLFNVSTVFLPNNAGSLFDLVPNNIWLLFKYMLLVDSILMVSLDNRPIDFSLLINTESLTAFNIILVELSIICGEVYSAGLVGENVLKFSLAKLNVFNF